MALKPKYKIRHENALIKKAITALFVNPEQQSPIAENTAAKRINPMYDPAMPPLSIPLPADNDEMVKM